MKKEGVLHPLLRLRVVFKQVCSDHLESINLFLSFFRNSGSAFLAENDTRMENSILPERLKAAIPNLEMGAGAGIPVPKHPRARKVITDKFQSTSPLGVQRSTIQYLRCNINENAGLQEETRR